MPDTAIVTKQFTKGYAEVAQREENGQPGDQRWVAENPVNADRGDLVALEPAQPWNDRFARTAYVAPPVMFLLGMLLSNGFPMADRLLTGGVFFLLTFGMAWIMNRRARLRRHLSYRVTEILEKAPDGWTV